MLNLTRARDDKQYSLLQHEQRHGRFDSSSSATWEAELDAAVNNALSISPQPNGTSQALSSANLLRARINAVRAQLDNTKQAVSGLKSRSRDVEFKYKHLVALAARCTDTDVDSLLDGLVRAVESEKGELEIGRVRRFLGGVDGAC